MQQSKLRKSLLIPSLSRTVIICSLISVVTMGTSVIYFNRSQTKKTPVKIANITPSNPTINALGRLEPQGQVIKIASASTNGGNGSKLAQLLVDEGETVKTGQVIAILDSRNQLTDTLNEARSKVEIAKSRLNQVQAGAKQGEVTARQATISRLQAESGQNKVDNALIARLEAELQGQKQTLQATVARVAAEKRNADSDVKRYESLYKQGAISSQEVDKRRLSAETSTALLLENQANQNRVLATLKQQINEAKANREKTIATLKQQINEAEANLNQTLEVRPTDIANAQAEVDSAVATVKRIQTELDLSYIRAPQAGRILRVQTRPGETVSDKGIVELAQTEQMYAIAEVYESDISKIRLLQTAIITSPSNVFSGKLRGTVKQIGSQIAKKDILETDPTAASDARVIEVKIKLDKASSQQVANFINLQVNVEINL